MTKITKAAALAHAKAQVGQLHIVSAPNGYGFNERDAKGRGWWTSQSAPYQQARRMRAMTIQAHATAALVTGTTDTAAAEYREAFADAQC
jgi:hypothetical protein